MSTSLVSLSPLRILEFVLVNFASLEVSLFYVEHLVVQISSVMQEDIEDGYNFGIAEPGITVFL